MIIEEGKEKMNREEKRNKSFGEKGRIRRISAAFLSALKLNFIQLFYINSFTFYVCYNNRIPP